MTVPLHRFFYKISYASWWVQQYHTCLLRVTTHTSIKCLVCGNHTVSLNPAIHSSVITDIINIDERLLKGSLNNAKFLAFRYIGNATPLVYVTCKQAFNETNTWPWITASLRSHLFIACIQSRIVWNLDYYRYCIGESQYLTLQYLGMLKGKVLAPQTAAWGGTT